MVFAGMELVILIASVALSVLGIFIAYLIVKAAVRNGILEAYIRLRREKLYPPA